MRQPTHPSSFTKLLGLLVILILTVFLLTSFIDMPIVMAASSPSKTPVITIPLSALDVGESTATISVLQEAQSPLHTLLSACQSNLPEELIIEEKDLSEDVKKLCQMAERFTRKHTEPPKHNLDAKGYIITVPLKTTRQGIVALIWNTSTLDDAMTFVNLLQSGKLKSVKAYTSIPWNSDSQKPCMECPIKELVFHADGIKEQLELLRDGSEIAETPKN